MLVDVLRKGISEDSVSYDREAGLWENYFLGLVRWWFSVSEKHIA